MADIRINALPTTATDFASDDYIAIDGTTNGTRKLNAKTANLTFSDVTLGTSGPSVKSTLSARAPRQGLVFDGTAVTTSWAGNVLGTGDFTASAWIYIREQPAASQIKDIFSSTGGSAFALRVNTYGGFFFDVASTYSGGTNLINATPYIGKWAHVVYSRSYSGTTTFYVNGVSAATRSPNDTTNYSGTTNTIGTNAFPGTIAGPLLYNRALSASEVVALYEAGAPAGADYNSASGTTILSGTFVDGVDGTYYKYTTFSGASATGFTATSNSTGYKTATSPTAFTVVKGTKYLLRYTLTLNSGSAPKASIGDPSNLSYMSSEPTLVAGTNTIEFTCTTTASNAKLNFWSNAANDFSLSNVSLVRLGLLLAPDAAQAGGGLVWYDTSGNAANITLPASGVSWNVPSSAKTATGWSFLGNLAAGANITYAQAGTATLTIGEQGNAHSADNNRNIAYRWKYNKTADAGLGGTFQLLPMLANYPNAPTEGSVMLSVATNGNLLLKSDGVDGGQKLQVSGTAAVSSTLSVGGNTASQQLHLNVDVYGANKSGGMRIGNSGNNYYSDLLVTTDSSSNPFVKLSFATHQLFQYAYGGGGNSWTFYTNNTTALTLSGSDQSATFAGNVGSNAAFRTLAASSFPGAVSTNGFSYYFGSSAGGAVIYGKGSVSDVTLANKDGSDVITIPTGTTNAKFTGSIAIGNTVQTAVGVASTHKVTISIGGTTYYLLATNV